MRLPNQFWEIAERLMDVVWTGTGFPVVVYDHEGTIVRATDKSRIGDLHAGAQKIMQGLVDEYAVTPEEAAGNPLVREGYNCAIVIDGQRVAAFGITGKLEQTKPLARVAVKLLDAWIADLKHREELAASERKYRSIFDHSAQGIFQSTTEGRILTANAALARMYGYASPEELLAAITDAARQLYNNPEDRKQFLAQLHEKSRLTGFLTQFKRSDGTVIDVSINAHFVTDPGSGQRLIEGIVEDITARRKAEKALKKSEEKFFKAFNNSPVWVVLSSIATGRYIEVNETFLRGMGYIREEVIGRTSQEIQSWEDQNERSRVQDVLMKEGAVRNIEVSRRTRNGRIRTMLFSAEIIDLAGEACMLSVSQDISARKAAEAQLKESHERFLTVLESIDATINVVDMQSFEILYMNEKMKQIYGADLTGQVCWKVFRKASAPCSICSIDQLLDAAGNPTDVCVWEDQNPVNGRWYVNNDRAIRWGDGRMVRLQVATDITRQKAIDQERKGYEARIQQMQKMEAIGMLAGGIAHDFNNILSAVIGYAELALIDTPEVSSVHNNIRQIHAAGGRARDLVKQILTFSRQDEKELRPLRIGSQVKEALKMLRSSLPTTIEITSRIEAGVDNIMADPTQIHQIVMNLCTNAAQAMEEKGGRLTIRLSQEILAEEDVRLHPGLEPGAYAKLSVQDTGIGIRADIMDKIYHPYFTTKAKGKGTGLGLAVVHGIVQNYGGDITVTSTPGTGTTFEIYLPTIKTAVQPAPTESPMPMGREKILLVDDENVIVDIGRQGLERLGYQVEGYTSSVDALDRFYKNSNDYDLIITDMTMPRLTGDQLAIEALKRRPDIPIILCTGYSSRIDRRQAKIIGIRAMLMKPLNLNDLARTVRRVLDTPPEENHIRLPSGGDG